LKIRNFTLRELCDNIFVIVRDMNEYKPKFTINNQILTNIANIVAAKEFIESAPLIPAWEAKFRREAIERTVHHGTHLEGNRLNLEQAKEVLDGRQILAKQDDIQDIINYREVLNYIDNVAKKEGKLTEDVLLKIHSLTVDKLLPEDQKGKYRTQQVYVTNSRTGEVSFTPPKPEEVGGGVKYFLEWLNSEESENIHPTLKAGVVHYNLARIHPFVDGNGRTSRACATLVLFLSGYDIKKFFALEEYYDTDAASYYQALQETSNQKVINESERDLTGFLEYFTKGLAVELIRVRERVQHLSSDLRLKKRVGQLALTERQAKIVEYIQSYGKITNREWRSLLPDYSDDTVLRDLKDLIKKKIIKKKGTTKSAAYVMK